MPYTITFRISEWLRCESWEAEGVTHVKFMQDRNPNEVGCVARLVLHTELDKETEVEVNPC